MHPFILEQLAAAHIRDQLVVAADARRARQARRARSQASGQRTRLSLPGTGAGPARRPAPLVAVRPAADSAGACAGGSARGTHSNTWTEFSAASAATPNEEIEMAPIYPRQADTSARFTRRPYRLCSSASRAPCEPCTRNWKSPQSACSAPGLRRRPTRWPGSGPAAATALPAGTCPACPACRPLPTAGIVSGQGGQVDTRHAADPRRHRMAPSRRAAADGLRPRLDR